MHERLGPALQEGGVSEPPTRGVARAGRVQQSGELRFACLNRASARVEAGVCDRLARSRLRSAVNSFGAVEVTA